VPELLANARIILLSTTGATRAALVEALRAELFVVEMAGPGATAQDAIGEGPDAVLVDASAALRASLCSELRLLTGVPILAIGQPDGEDAADCLERGADDYLARPDRPKECVARLRARLRRHPPRPKPDQAQLSSGDLVLDHDSHEVKVSGRVVHLPLKQFQLLELLLANAGRVIPHSTIADRIWGRAAVDQNTLQAQVARLRKALGDGPVPERIRAVRGIGYTFSR
jgi:two-component system response regulator RegX3